MLEKFASFIRAILVSTHIFPIVFDVSPRNRIFSIKRERIFDLEVRSRIFSAVASTRIFDVEQHDQIFDVVVSGRP